jgi:hypothetical protein
LEPTARDFLLASSPGHVVATPPQRSWWRSLFTR